MASPPNLEDHEDEQVAIYSLPPMPLAEQRFSLVRARASSSTPPTSTLLAELQKLDMLATYDALIIQLGLARDEVWAKSSEGRIEKRRQELEAKVKDAEANEGESEVRLALLRLAMFHVRVSGYDVAVKALERAFEKTVGPGQKIDLVFCLARLALFHERPDACRGYVARAKGLLDVAGDWERRNRLKVYQGVLHLHAREFELAAERFLETLSSFNADELFPYAQHVHYATLAGALTLDRPQLQAKLLESPEVRSVSGDRPLLLRFVETLHEGEYAAFILVLVDFVDGMAGDVRVCRHAAWYGREMRIKAYAQFLQAYRTVTLEAMAQVFGLPTSLLEAEMAHFIAGGRVEAKIDAVRGLLETQRREQQWGPGPQYGETLRQGDLLLSRIQKLSRVIHQ